MYIFFYIISRFALPHDYRHILISCVFSLGDLQLNNRNTLVKSKYSLFKLDYYMSSLYFDVLLHVEGLEFYRSKFRAIYKYRVCK